MPPSASPVTAAIPAAPRARHGRAMASATTMAASSHWPVVRSIAQVRSSAQSSRTRRASTTPPAIATPARDERGEARSQAPGVGDQWRAQARQQRHERDLVLGEPAGVLVHVAEHDQDQQADQHVGARETPSVERVGRSARPRRTGPSVDQARAEPHDRRLQAFEEGARTGVRPPRDVGRVLPLHQVHTKRHIERKAEPAADPQPRHAEQQRPQATDAQQVQRRSGRAAAQHLPHHDHRQQWQRVGHLAPEHDRENWREPQPATRARFEVDVEPDEQQRQRQQQREVDVQDQRALNGERAEQRSATATPPATLRALAGPRVRSRASR